MTSLEAAKRILKDGSCYNVTCRDCLRDIHGCRFAREDTKPPVKHTGGVDQVSREKLERWIAENARAPKKPLSAERPVLQFESGKWYHWVGPRKRRHGWNEDGEMDFILDGRPHPCNVGHGCNASFFDSSNPTREWVWCSSSMEHFREVPDGGLWLASLKSNVVTYLESEPYVSTRHKERRDLCTRLLDRI